jgi:hypothetical protein
MSIIKFPKWTIDTIKSHMANFFWNDTEEKHKYHLANFQSLCQKEQGGLGIPDLRNMNMCLLASWIQRYQDAGPKLWRKIVDAKYQTVSPNIFCCSPRNGSPFWKGVLWVAQAAKMGFRWSVGNGRRVRFYEDHSFGTCSLASQYWEIYLIVNEQGCTVREAWDGENLKSSFRRTVNSRLMQLWYELVEIARGI